MYQRIRGCDLAFTVRRHIPARQIGVGRGHQRTHTKDHLRFRQQIQRLACEGDSVHGVAGEIGDARTDGEHGAPDGPCLLGRHLLPDTPFGLLQAGLGRLQLIGEHQVGCLLNKEERACAYQRLGQRVHGSIKRAASSTSGTASACCTASAGSSCCSYQALARRCKTGGNVGSACCRWPCSTSANR